MLRGREHPKGHSWEYGVVNTGKGMSGVPTVIYDVYHGRNMGWPTGREPYGHGASVVVSERESLLQGEGKQVEGWKQAESLDYVKCGDDSEGVLPGHWRAVCGESRRHGSEGDVWKSTA